MQKILMAGFCVGKKLYNLAMDYYKLKKNETFLISQKAFIVSKGRLLTLKLPKSKRKEWSGKWGLPGGLLEMNERMEDGLIREVKEETGLTITVEQICTASDFRYKGFIFKDGRKLKVRFIEIGFICKYNGGEILTSEEHAEHKWASKSDLNKLDFAPDSKKLIKDYLHRF